jgi:hypothetical protein
MLLRSVFFTGLAVVLCACSDGDWDKATTYNTIENPAVASRADAPVAAPSAPVETASIAPPAAPGVPEQASPPPAAALAQETTTTTTTTVEIPTPLPDYMPPAAPEPAPAIMAAQAVAPPASPADGFCRENANSAAKQAIRDGYEPEMQQQVYDATYRQCLSYYGVAR